jgi:hypothetical protein
MHGMVGEEVQVAVAGICSAGISDEDLAPLRARFC